MLVLAKPCAQLMYHHSMLVIVYVYCAVLLVGEALQALLSVCARCDIPLLFWSPKNKIITVYLSLLGGGYFGKKIYFNNENVIP